MLSLTRRARADGFFGASADPRSLAVQRVRAGESLSLCMWAKARHVGGMGCQTLLLLAPYRVPRTGRTLDPMTVEAFCSLGMTRLYLLKYRDRHFCPRSSSRWGIGARFFFSLLSTFPTAGAFFHPLFGRTSPPCSNDVAGCQQYRCLERDERRRR